MSGSCRRPGSRGGGMNRFVVGFSDITSPSSEVEAG